MQKIVSTYASVFLVFTQFFFTSALWCDRTPAGVSVPKAQGDGGFKIHISGDPDKPDKYIPGAVYTVKLQGPGDQFTTEKFLGFLLVAEPADRYSPEVSAGHFQLTSDSLARFSEFCSHAVKHASELPKAEVQVRWTAPPESAGCVNFRATIIKNKGVWFMDDGELTKQLCPESTVGQVVDEEDEPCCACDEAKYELTFEGMWSLLTHPKDFPDDQWRAHFGDIIGASHSPKYRFWDYGGVASEAVRHIAESEDLTELERELKQQSGSIRTIIKARGLRRPNFFGHKTYAVFRADKEHNMISIVSKIAPSPDWFVGVSGLNLCLKNCSWAVEKTLPLYPWDAGTNNGVSYLSPKEPTIPRDRIGRIVWKGDKASPFYDPSGNMVKPFARLRVQKLRTYEQECSRNSRNSGYSNNMGMSPDYGSMNMAMSNMDDIYDDSEDRDRPECDTTPWSEWSSCSSTCGKGIRKRWRQYTNEDMATKFGCNRKLTSESSCSLLPCNNDRMDPYKSPSYGSLSDTMNPSYDPYGGNSGFNQDDPCAVSNWYPWGTCSVTCGKGLKIRYRQYVNADAARRHHCSTKLRESSHCYGVMTSCPDGEDQEMKPGCEVSEWGEWSKCSVTLCGQGSQTRRRIYSNNSISHQGCNVELMQSRTCAGLVADCSELHEICKLPKVEGRCYLNRNYIRWHFDMNKGKCLKFIYDGCEGNKNNFETKEDCENTCGAFFRDKKGADSGKHNPYFNPLSPAQGSSYGAFGGTNRYSSDHHPTSFGGNYRNHNSPSYYNNDEPVLDCVVSEWSDWSECSVACGRGRKYRTRFVRVFPQNNGKPCPKLEQRRKCKGSHCPPHFSYHRYNNLYSHM